MWRIFQLDKSLSKGGARWAKFGSGNWDSLMKVERPSASTSNGNGTASLEKLNEDVDDGGEAGREVRGILLDWYAKHYSANRMTLAIYGKGTSQFKHSYIYTSNSCDLVE